MHLSANLVHSRSREAYSPYRQAFETIDFKLQHIIHLYSEKNLHQVEEKLKVLILALHQDMLRVHRIHESIEHLLDLDESAHFHQDLQELLVGVEKILYLQQDHCIRRYSRIIQHLLDLRANLQHLFWRNGWSRQENSLKCFHRKCSRFHVNVRKDVLSGTEWKRMQRNVQILLLEWQVLDRTDERIHAHSGGPYTIQIRSMLRHLNEMKYAARHQSISHYRKNLELLCAVSDLSDSVLE